MILSFKNSTYKYKQKDSHVGRRGNLFTIFAA